MLGLSIVDKTEHRQLFPQIPIRPSGYYHHFVDCYEVIFNKLVLSWYGKDKHRIQTFKTNQSLGMGRYFLGMVKYIWWLKWFLFEWFQDFAYFECSSDATYKRLCPYPPRKSHPPFRTEKPSQWLTGTSGQMWQWGRIKLRRFPTMTICDHKTMWPCDYVTIRLWDYVTMWWWWKCSQK